MDVTVVINRRARRGSERVVRECARQIPHATVLVSRDLEDAHRIAAEIAARPPRLLVSAGGDGTAISLLNAVRPSASHEGALLGGGAFALLRLGTGNAWANVTSTPKWRPALRELERLAADPAPLPVQTQELLEVEGSLTPFAGAGLDAEIIDDFHAQKRGPALLPRRMRQGLVGYLNGLFTRTIPRTLVTPHAEVEIVNTGEPALTVDDEGRVIPLPGGEPGAVLYRGPMSVCGAATTPESGFRFRAYPFARAKPGRFCARVYAGKTMEAALAMGKLWRGEHPLANMHTWLLTSCEMTFSRPVPFQIGGDRVGARTRIAYRLASASVQMLDWERI